MRTLFLLALLAALAWPAAHVGGQTVKQPPNAPLDTTYLRDHAETRGFMLGRPTSAKPTPDGKAVLFLRSEPRSPKLRLYEFDVASGKARELLTPEQVLKGAEEHLTAEEKARRERMRISVGGFTSFHLSEDGAHVLLSLSGKLYVLERTGDKVQELQTGTGTILDPKFSPDGKQVAYVRDNDVYALDLATQKETRVTTGGSDKLTHGLAEFVAQEEMSRFSGYWWSSDNRSIVYEEADASGVEVWYVADPIHPEQPPFASSYPRPGKANVRVRLGVVSAGGGPTTWITWDTERYPYLASVRWEKGAPLTLAVQTRDQKELLLLRADAETGKTMPLVRETDPAWVNLHQDVPRWFEDGSAFLWTSERDGGPQLELRDSTGDLRRVLVPPDAGYQDLVDLDSAAGSAVYHASADPSQSRVFRVSLKGGDPELLTRAPGSYAAAFSKNHAVYTLTAALPAAMPKTTVQRSDGTGLGELPSVAEDPPFVPRAELLKVGDGPGFYAAVIRPRDFDPHKRYPVLVDVYGGPGHLVVRAPMNVRLLDQWLADQGFLVVSLDGRGTPGRGRDWERSISKHFGSVPLDEQVAGLQALGRRFPEMDLDRVGIVGWSFGGYLSALAVLRRPDVYKAAVAGAPVVDWLDYDTHYTERYLGLPDMDAAAYKEGSLLTYAADLKRPLLIIHGTADDNVYFRHTLKLANALFRAGKEFELLPLPGLTHMVPDPVVTQRLWSRIALHFQEHLGKPAGHGEGAQPVRDPG
jgi:dipeptidyl-peptidase-4